MSTTTPRPVLSRTLATILSAALLCGTVPAARAHPSDISEASALSMLPVAMVVAAPAMLLSGGVMLTVVAVESTAKGTLWVLERASDGARASVECLGSVALAVGTGLVVTAVSAGWVLSAAGQAVAFIPNQIGASLLYNERVTR
jgi:hypothetical protein